MGTGDEEGKKFDVKQGYASGPKFGWGYLSPAKRQARPVQMERQHTKEHEAPDLMSKRYFIIACLVGFFLSLPVFATIVLIIEWLAGPVPG